jgi:uncharacterized damage-inducible protein DinB
VSITVEDLVTSIRSSREHFLKHIDGLTAEQWDWKPYPECMSVRETLGHLIVDDLAALESLESEEEPEYDVISQHEMQAERLVNLDVLKSRLTESHEKLCTYILGRWSTADLDSEICVWGNKMTLVRGISHLSSEDFYHSGQIAFIRMATDPSWNYYGAIYGM